MFPKFILVFGAVVALGTTVFAPTPVSAEFRLYGHGVFQKYNRHVSHGFLRHMRASRGYRHRHRPGSYHLPSPCPKLHSDGGYTATVCP
jgi:hypothetical protein